MLLACHFSLNRVGFPPILECEWMEMDTCTDTVCQKSRGIGCVIPHCKLQHGITQPILWLFWHICMAHALHARTSVLILSVCEATFWKKASIRSAVRTLREGGKRKNDLGTFSGSQWPGKKRKLILPKVWTDFIQHISMMRKRLDVRATSESGFAQPNTIALYNQD